MKMLLLIPALVFSSLALSFQTENPEAGALSPRWERLGSRKVNFRIDRDEIAVTAREGVFTALKFKVTGAPINLRKMTVHYGNGQTDDIDLRFNIPAGGESRVIDLQGNRRVIKKVVFWYDTKNAAGKRGTLHLFGRQ